MGIIISQSPFGISLLFEPPLSLRATTSN